jgi:hypothetical protein
MQPNSDAELLTAQPATTSRRLIFHPLVVVTCSIAAGAACAAWITWRRSGSDLEAQYVYVVPIIVAFMAFLSDRAEHGHRFSRAGVAIDLAVVGTAILRVVTRLPFISGHALFLSYAMLGPSTLVTRITASVVLGEVIYLKYFVWHDPITSTVGIVLGTIAALLARRVGSKRKDEAPIAA